MVLLRRKLLLSLVVGTAVAVACGGGSSSPNENSPAATPTPPRSGETPASPTTTLDAAPSPVPEIEPLTDEELRLELRSLPAYIPQQWPRTNFRLLSVPLREFDPDGPAKDGIPPLDDPKFVPIEEADDWLDDREPVQVADINGDARAYPQQVLIWHEVVNDVVGGEPIVVTFCPLCNTAFVFRRTLDGRVLDFGTTGLLRFSNLVMYDRQTESWWQEFAGEAIVGDMTGRKLELLPLSIVSWAEFKATFPQGIVLSRETGYRRPYGRNPYIFYDTEATASLFDGPTDDRLRPLERVVAIEIGGEPLAVPFSVLEREPVVHLTLAGQDLVVFFQRGTASSLDNVDIAKARDVGATGVFDPHLDGTKLSFGLEGGSFMDAQTGSTWSLLGKAVDGPLAGRRLTPIVNRPAQFWFSWVVYRPATAIYRGSGG